MNRLLLLATAATVALTGAAFAQPNGAAAVSKPAAAATAPAQTPAGHRAKAAPKMVKTSKTSHGATVKPAHATKSGKATATKAMKSAHRDHKSHGAVKPVAAGRPVTPKHAH